MGWDNNWGSLGQVRLHTSNRATIQAKSKRSGWSIRLKDVVVCGVSMGWMAAVLQPPLFFLGDDDVVVNCGCCEVTTLAASIIRSQDQHTCFSELLLPCEAETTHHLLLLLDLGSCGVARLLLCFYSFVSTPFCASLVCTSNFLCGRLVAYGPSGFLCSVVVVPVQCTA